jgi:hypothetical protein
MATKDICILYVFHFILFKAQNINFGKPVLKLTGDFPKKTLQYILW